MSALRKATYDFVVSPCGGLRLTVNGAEVLMRCSGAAWLERARALIVADLHFEKGSSYARRGQMLPPYDTRETLSRLEAEVIATSPAVLIFLGDSFHDREGAARLLRLPPRPTCRWIFPAPFRLLSWQTSSPRKGCR